MSSNIEVIYGHRNNFDTADAIEEIVLQSLSNSEAKGTLYFGYPIVAKQFDDEGLLVEALLVTEEHGVIVFTPSNLPVNKIQNYQDDLYVFFEGKLKNNDNLKRRRDLIPSLNVVTYLPHSSNEEYTVTNVDDFVSVLNEGLEKEQENKSSFKYINTVVESIVNLKPKVKREISNPNSKGALLRDIEKEIANLDGYQKKAALEVSNGPQRIRGLAGSGKTIVLALKAAYLHTAHPTKKICITFNTRSLKEQFVDLVRRFTFEHINDEPNWDNLSIIHAWGSNSEEGIYFNICKTYQQGYYNFGNAKNRFGYSNAFQGSCDELLNNIKLQENKPLYDILLIDEAQDLPQSFFELCLKIIKEDKHIIWAYDELQNIGKFTMESPEILFGKDSQGNPNIKDLINEPKQPRKDLVLKTCYRNPPNILAAAHSLGFGINRPGNEATRFIQFFDEPSFWEDIGYQVVSGELGLGKQVELERDRAHIPSYFNGSLENTNLATKTFGNVNEQYEYVANQIQHSLQNDEILPSDILIINANPLTTRKDLMPLLRYLAERGIDSHLAGVTSSVDEFFIDGKVTLSGIYRAKGNEAAMVFIVNSEYCYEGADLSTRRNILFTAMTRSKAWVHLLGCGVSMQALQQEVEVLRENNFKLKFTYPTEDELLSIRKIHRDLNQTEKQAFSNLENIIKQIEDQSIAPEIFQTLSKEQQNTLKNLFKND